MTKVNHLIKLKNFGDREYKDAKVNIPDDLSKKIYHHNFVVHIVDFEPVNNHMVTVFLHNEKNNIDTFSVTFCKRLKDPFANAFKEVYNYILRIENQNRQLEFNFK